MSIIQFAVLKSRKNLRAEAAALARFGRHIQELTKLYEEDLQAFAEKMVKESNLTRDVKAVEALEMEDGFAIQFKFDEPEPLP
jgi:hypothetical protein